MLDHIRNICPIVAERPGDTKCTSLVFQLWEPEDRTLIRRYYSHIEDKDGGVFRMVVWGMADGSDRPMVLDVKEQSVLFPMVNSTLIPTFCQALKSVAGWMMRNHPDPMRLLPGDVLNNSVFAVLDLKTPRSVGEFEQALKAKSRLGRFVMAD